MVSKQSCSWCHNMNDVRERWCGQCGHAAHRPRCECDCRQCMGVLFDRNDMADTPIVIPNPVDRRKEV